MEQEPNTIETEANRWVIRLDAGPMSADDQAEFDRWIASDPRRHGAFVRARSAWLDADRLGALAAGKMPALPSPAHARYRRWLIAAGVAVITAASSAVWYVRTPAGQTYTSEIGEVRRIELSDGSELTLNTDTRATVRFGQSERDIVLNRGEVLFEVAHDTSRPFVVQANEVRVRAVGTVFTVRVDDERVDVIVTEGVVEVSRGGAPAEVQRIGASHRAVIASRDSRVDIEPIDSAGMTRKLAWREGMLAFAGEPLSVAVAEINRYSRVAIFVDDPVLAARPVIGIFRADDAEGFASAASATFNAEVVREDSAIHLRSAAMTQ